MKRLQLHVLQSVSQSCSRQSASVISQSVSQLVSWQVSRSVHCLLASQSVGHSVMYNISRPHRLHIAHCTILNIIFSFLSPITNSKLEGGGYCKFQIGVCREGSQTLTLFKDEAERNNY